MTLLFSGSSQSIEMRFSRLGSLGDVDHGDRNGTGNACSNGVVDPDGLELRDGVESEGSWASGGELVHGRYCEGVRLNRGRERNF